MREGGASGDPGFHGGLRRFVPGGTGKAKGVARRLRRHGACGKVVCRPEGRRYMDGRGNVASPWGCATACCSKVCLYCAEFDSHLVAPPAALRMREWERRRKVLGRRPALHGRQRECCFGWGCATACGSKVTLRCMGMVARGLWAGGGAFFARPEGRALRTKAWGYRCAA